MKDFKRDVKEKLPEIYKENRSEIEKIQLRAPEPEATRPRARVETFVVYADLERGFQNEVRRHFCGSFQM